jgi:hypothetical protein
LNFELIATAVLGVLLFKEHLSRYDLTAVIDGISSQATTFIKGVVGGLVNMTLGIVLFNAADLLQIQAVAAS